MRTRYVHVVCLAVAFTTGIAFSQKVPSAFKAPKLSVDKLEIDLGELYAGDIKTVRFKIKNAGGDTLSIGEISTSCGCTTVKQPRQHLLKNQSDVMEVKFNSTNFRGSIAKRVYIKSNDPTTPVTTLTLNAFIRNELEVVWPRTPINLGTIAWDKAVLIRLKMKNSGGSPVTLVGVDEEAGRVSIRSGLGKILPQDSGIVELTFFPKKEGFLNEQIYLKTDSRVQNRISVRVFYTAVVSKKSNSMNHE